MAIKTKISELRVGLRRISSLHFLYIIFLGGQTIAYDAGKLLTPEVTLRRWIAISVLLVAVSIVWYIARDGRAQESTLKKLLFTLITFDIAMASFMVYLSRGMASKAVLLYVIPVILSSAMARKSAMVLASLLSVAAYIATCVAYFVLNFNEGYKLELYGEILFYSAVLLLLPKMIWEIIKPKN